MSLLTKLALFHFVPAPIKNSSTRREMCTRRAVRSLPWLICLLVAIASVALAPARAIELQEVMPAESFSPEEELADDEMEFWTNSPGLEGEQEANPLNSTAPVEAAPPPIPNPDVAVLKRRLAVIEQQQSELEKIIATTSDELNQVSGRLSALSETDDGPLGLITSLLTSAEVAALAGKLELAVDALGHAANLAASHPEYRFAADEINRYTHDLAQIIADDQFAALDRDVEKFCTLAPSLRGISSTATEQPLARVKESEVEGIKSWRAILANIWSDLKEQVRVTDLDQRAPVASVEQIEYADAGLHGVCEGLRLALNRRDAFLMRHHARNAVELISGTYDPRADAYSQVIDSLGRLATAQVQAYPDLASFECDLKCTVY